MTTTDQQRRFAMSRDKFRLRPIPAFRFDWTE
jgi:hypothetical protein